MDLVVLALLWRVRKVLVESSAMIPAKGFVVFVSWSFIGSLTVLSRHEAIC